MRKTGKAAGTIAIAITALVAGSGAAAAVEAPTTKTTAITACSSGSGHGELSNGNMTGYSDCNSAFIWYKKTGGATINIRFGFYVGGVAKGFTSYREISQNETEQYDWSTSAYDPGKNCIQAFMDVKGGNRYVTKQWGQC